MPKPHDIIMDTDPDSVKRQLVRLAHDAGEAYKRALDEQAKLPFSVTLGSPSEVINAGRHEEWKRP